MSPCEKRTRPHSRWPVLPVRTGTDGVFSERKAMTDLGYLGLTVLFFAVSVLFAAGCERL